MSHYGCRLADMILTGAAGCNPQRVDGPGYGAVAVTVQPAVALSPEGG